MTRLKEIIQRSGSGALFPFVLAFLAIALFFDFIFFGYVMDGAYDRRNNVMPYYYIFSRAFQHLEIPQWNPYLFCGNSVLANSTYVFFYPLNWIIWAAPESAIPFVTTAVLLVHFILAGVFMWLLARELSGESFWSLTATIGYLLSSASMMSLFTNTEQFLTLVYGPLLLYLMMSHRKRSPLASYLLQTTAAALLMTGGMVQFIIYLMGVFVLFAVFQAIADRGLGLRAAVAGPLTTAASLASAFLISAVRYFPFYLGTKRNALVTMSYGDFLRLNTTPPESLMKFFLPELFPWINKGESFNAYAGVAAAFIGLYAILFIWDKKAIFWKLVAVGITLTVIGTPLAYIHFILTAKSNLSVGRMAVLVPMLIAALTAYAGKRIIEQEEHRSRFIKFTAVIFVVVLIVALFFYSIASPPPGQAAEQLREMRESIVHFILLSFAFIGILFYLHRSRNTLAMAYFKGALIVIVIADLLMIARIDINSQNPSFIQEPFYISRPHELTVDGIFEESNRNFRILGFGEGTSYNRSIHLNLYNSTGYESVPPFYITSLYGYPYLIDRSSGIYRHVGPHISPYQQRALELTSTRLIVGDEYVNEIPTSLPRYSLYSEYVVIKDDHEALKRLLVPDDSFNIGNTVVLNAQPDLPVGQANARGSVRVLEEKLNSIVFEVVSPSNMILLLNDTYDPDWSAEIDGVRTLVLRANYAFRAIAVPQGTHRVRFSYSAEGFEAGKIISLTSLLIFASLCVLFIFRRSASRRVALHNNANNLR